jgi:hypothetical protein
MRNDRFDVLERYVPLFGASEPSFERFLRRRDRKRRNQRITAGVVGVAVFAAAVAGIWIATSGGSIHGRQHKPASGPTTPPEVPEGPIGLIGLPPKAATPSTPRRGELVLSFTFGHTTGDPGRFMLHVYADGRLIWERLGDVGAGTSSTGLIEQRLTPEGVEFVRSEVLSTGFFDRDLYLTDLHGLTFGQVEVHDGERVTRVTWGDITGPVGVEQTPPTAEQASALKRLDGRLEDPASWLPASAWEDPEMKPYIPSGYSVCYDTEQGVGLERVLASLPTPVEDRLRSLKRTHEATSFGPGPGRDIWCSSVTTDQARALTRSLADAGIGKSVDSALVYESRPRVPYQPEVSIAFSPVLPNQA